MVRILVVSDTHGDLRQLARVRAQAGPVDWLLHAGDHLQDAARVGAMLGLDPAQVRAVVGNCDYPVSEPAQELLEFEQVKILLTHGHHYGVKHTIDRFYYRAQELGARVAIFGHSHIPVNVDAGGILLFNPGSLSLPRIPQDPPSCGLLEIAGHRVTACHLYAS